MERVRKILLFKIVLAALFSVALIALFSIPLDPSAPPLGRLLFPGSGIWGVPSGYSSEEWTIDGLTDDVTVYRDEWGIPHIYGNNQNDIAFALGYTQAEDRLFFMDLARRFARGQLSEILGPSTLGTDMVTKTKLLEYSAEKMYRSLQSTSDPELRAYYEYVESFVRGVNFYVKTHPDLPLEFRLLDYEFRPWTGLDCMAIAYFMLEGGPWGYWDIDQLVVLSAFIEKYGERQGVEYFSQLFGNPGAGIMLPYQIPVNSGYGEYPDIVSTGKKMARANREASDIHKLAANFSRFLAVIDEIPFENRYIDAAFSGSNSWSVHGKRTKSGKPLACSDSHEPWQIPNIYYETHLVNMKSGLNFYGYYVAGGAGTPVDGHNQYLTYGLTVCYWDQIDWYYYEKVDENHYLYRGEPKAYEEPITVDIKVKGQEPVQHTIRRTVHGPVFSDLAKDKPAGLKNLPAAYKDMIIAARWLSHTSPKVFELGTSLLGMSEARNLREFREALRNFEAPPNHVTYADVEGNVYVHSMGGFPIRDNRNLPSWHLGNGFLPYNGSRGEGEWIGMVSFDELPHTKNPREGYVVGANQIAAGPQYFKKHAGQFRYREGYRARRINEVLSSRRDFTAAEMMKLQADTKSIRAEDFIPHILKALVAKKERTPLEEQTFEILSDWDFRMDKEAVAPSIFKAWVEYFSENTFRDEWKMLGLGDRLYPLDPILEKLVRTDPGSHWFDDVSTPEVEGARDIILRSLEKALAALQNHFGTDDISQWKWGKIHQLQFVHMTEIKALAYGPVPINGSSNTVMAPYNTLLQEGEFKPTHVTHGAHHRMVVDFGDLRNCRSVLPGGVSGLTTLGSPYDQFDLFTTDTYHTEHFTATTPERFLKECKSVTSVINFRKGGR